MLDLVDVWRVKTSQSRRYTWSQKSQLIFCRLDYWLISNNLQDFVNTTDIIPAIKTDHAAIELNLTESNHHSKRPGFWKMNVSLLEDPNILKELRQNIPVSKTTSSDILSDKRYSLGLAFTIILGTMPILFSKTYYEKKLTTRIQGSQKKQKQNKTKQNKKPLDPSDSNYSCKGTMARAWRENKSIYKLLSNFTKTYSCQKTYKKTANKRFHYILPF